MESRGLTLESLFRAKYKLPEETNVFSLIQEAIVVASWEKTEEFLMRRMSIAEAIFSNDSCSAEATNVQDKGSDKCGDGAASKKRSLITSAIDATLPSKDDDRCSLKKDCADSDRDGSKKGKSLITKLPKQQNGVTSDVSNKKLDPLNGQVDGDKKAKRPINPKVRKEGEVRKRPLDHHADAAGSEKKKQCPRIYDNGDVRRRQSTKAITMSSENDKEVTREIKKKDDQDMAVAHQTDFEAIIRDMDSMHRKFPGNIEKIHVPDADYYLPPPKPRCNEVSYRRCNDVSYRRCNDVSYRRCKEVYVSYQRCNEVSYRTKALEPFRRQATKF